MTALQEPLEVEDAIDTGCVHCTTPSAKGRDLSEVLADNKSAHKPFGCDAVVNRRVGDTRAQLSTDRYS